MVYQFLEEMRGTAPETYSSRNRLIALRKRPLNFKNGFTILITACKSVVTSRRCLFYVRNSCIDFMNSPLSPRNRLWFSGKSDTVSRRGLSMSEIFTRLREHHKNSG
jgi:hypothetical protein